MAFGPLFQMKPIVVYKQRSLLSLNLAKREMFLASQIITKADQLLLSVHSSPLIFFSKTSKRSSKNKATSARRKYAIDLSRTASYEERSKCELKPIFPRNFNNFMFLYRHILRDCLFACLPHFTNALYFRTLFWKRVLSFSCPSGSSVVLSQQ